MWTEGWMNTAPVPPGGRWQRQQRDRIGKGLSDSCKTVLCPWPGLHGEHPNAAAVRDATESISGIDSNAFLSEDDGPDPGDSGGLFQAIHGNYPDELNSFLLQDSRDGI
tara:strand:- start:18 stop:344 length:327 start_codon:yes stop_codon:yes gene_type:complete